VTNLPAKVSSVSLPTHLPPQIQRGLDIAVGRLDPPITGYRTRYAIAAADTPSPDLRQSLDLRRSRIDEWLRPAGVEHAAEQYRILLGVMAHRDDDAEGARLHAATFVQDLMDVPLFALTKACSDLRRGTVGDGKWMPEPGVVRSLAQGFVTALAKERREIDAVLTAEVKTSVPDPARKAALIETANKLAGQMSMNRAVEDARLAGRTIDPEEIPEARLSPEARHERAERRLAELKGKPLPKLSPYLAGKLGLLLAIPELEPVRSEDAA